MQILGTSFSALTDSNGYFAIKNVPVGTYVIQATKAGYGTKKFFYNKVISKDSSFFNAMNEMQSDDKSFSTWSWNGLSQLSNIEITEIINLEEEETFSFNYGFWMKQKGFFKGVIFERSYENSAFHKVIGQNANNFKLFFSKSPDVNSDNFEYTANDNIQALSVYFTSNSSNDTLLFYKPTSETLESMKSIFKKGETVYMTAYGSNYIFSNGDYYDFEQKKFVYTSLNPKKSNVISFMME